jgi:hypothetical protein
VKKAPGIGGHEKKRQIWLKPVLAVMAFRQVQVIGQVLWVFFFGEKSPKGHTAQIF